ncbi:MAG: FkbM family methyltransferase [Planctomycetota bacterium]
MSARGENWWRAYAVLSKGLAVLNRLPIGERSVKVGPDRLYAHSVDRFLALMSWKWGVGEREERALIERAVQPGMVALDVGANVGLHTLGLARRVGPEGRVHALEPEPDNFALLSRAVQKAHLANVRLHQVAASDAKGTLTLYLSDANRGDHRTSPAPEARRSFTVSATPIDDLLAHEPRIDFVKIDVQGAETIVLRGMKETLRRCERIGVLCELTPELLSRAGSSGEELLALFREPGLAPHRIAKTGDVEPITESAALEEAERSGYVNLYFARR